MKAKVKREKKFYILRFIFSRTFIVITTLALQFMFLWRFGSFLNDGVTYYYILLLNILITIFLINNQKILNHYKLTWIAFINILPGFGTLLFIILHISEKFYASNHKLHNIVIYSEKFYKSDSIDFANFPIAQQNLVNYLFYGAKFPCFTNNETKYYETGEYFFQDVLEDLKTAKYFIFLEYFILNDGVIWSSIKDILIEKAKQGVVVRLLYDGMNIISSFDKDYENVLERYNIHAKMFEPIYPFISSYQNNRNHMKILVIDNKIAYTGGINIGDEYANIINRFGEWKDSGIRIVGSAVNSFTIFFLQIWNITVPNNLISFKEFLIENDDHNYNSKDNDNCLIPFVDYPISNFYVSSNIFTQIFNSAKKRIYIMTPYLILDESLINTIIRSALRGVDVRIIIPHIPDKKYAFILSRSHYKELITANVKVYEFLPGFIHSKVYLIDDCDAIVGSINLDFRSLYLHYENGVYLHNVPCIKDIEKDFYFTFERSALQTMKDVNNFSLPQKFFAKILKIIAPLM